MSEALPEGWVEATLGEVANYGRTKKIEPANIDDDTWVLELEDIEKGSSKILKRVHFKDRKSKSTKNQFDKDDVLYGKLRPYLNKVVIADQNGVCTTEVIPLKSPDGIDYRYLFFSLKRPEFLDYVDAISHGLDMPRLGTNAGKAAPFPLAPLNEQRRIADKLDVVLGAVARCKARLDKTEILLKRFRQSTLNAATTGKLTEGWREENGILIQQDVQVLLQTIQEERKQLKKEKLLKANFANRILDNHPVIEIPETWRWTNLDAVAKNKNNALKAGPFGSSLKKDDCKASGYRVYGQEQVISGDEKLVTYYIDETKFSELNSCKVEPHDILISLVGTIGKILILSDNCEQGIINPRLVKISLHEGVSSQFIKLFLECPLATDYYKSFSHGGTMDILNLKILRGLAIALPPLEEQDEIVRRVETLFTFADRIEEKLLAARKRITRLEASLLAKAFRGELVPQNPTDEPASILLERIKSEREANASKPKRKRKAKA